MLIALLDVSSFVYVVNCAISSIAITKTKCWSILFDQVCSRSQHPCGSHCLIRTAGCIGTGQGNLFPLPGVFGCANGYTRTPSFVCPMRVFCFKSSTSTHPTTQTPLKSTASFFPFYASATYCIPSHIIVPTLSSGAIIIIAVLIILLFADCWVHTHTYIHTYLESFFPPVLSRFLYLSIAALSLFFFYSF